MIRIAIIFLALVAPFVLPWGLALAIGCIAAIFFPPVAIILGTLFEVLYGYGSIPYAFLTGIGVFAVSYWIRSFLQTRVMGI